MKKLALGTLLGIMLWMVLPFPVPVWGAPGGSDQGSAASLMGSQLEQQMEKLDLGPLEQFLQQVDRDLGGNIPQLNLRQLVADMGQGNMDLSPGEVFQGILKYLFKELVANSSLIGQLVILAVIAAVLANLQSAFDQDGVGKLAYTVGYLILITIAVGSFAIALNTGRESLDRMVTFMQALVPILLTLLVAVGGAASAALLHPAVAATASILGGMLQVVVLPLILLGTVLALVNHVSDRFQVSKMAGLLRESSLWILGLTETVFIGVISVLGVAGAVADGVTIRTAKYAAGSLVPVVGGMFSDALEVVVGSSLLIKNAVGLVGVGALFALCLFPILKILAISIVYRLASALLQPLGDSPVVDSLQTMSKGLTLVMVTVASVGLMFFLTVVVVVGAGNLNVMMR